MKAAYLSLTVRICGMCLTICQLAASTVDARNLSDSTKGAARVVANSKKTSPSKSSASRLNPKSRLKNQKAKNHVTSLIATYDPVSQRWVDKPTPMAASGAADLSDVGAISSAGASSSEISLPTPSSTSSWLGADQIVLSPIPRANMWMASISALGSTSSMEGMGRVDGNDVAVEHTGSSFGPSIGLMYGVSEHFFAKANFSYLPSQAETTVSGGEIGEESNTTSHSTIDAGWREPEIGIGATVNLDGQSRITGELLGTIPLGQATSGTQENETRTNGLDGGATIGPKLTAVASLAGIKLFTSLGYRFALIRTAEMSGVIPVGSTEPVEGSVSTSGGNKFSALLGLELPQAFNLGLAGLYSRTEPTEFETTTPALISRWSARSTAVGLGAILYSGIPIESVNTVLIPSVTYTTSDYQLENYSIDRFDTWSFGLQGLVYF